VPAAIRGDDGRIMQAGKVDEPYPITAGVAPGPSRGSLAGLSEAEAEARRTRGEGNAVPVTTGRSYKRIVLQNAFSPINVVLYAVVIALIVLGAVGDGLMTATLILANVAVGVVQESRAKRQLDRIALLTRPRARVVRDGVEREVGPAEIVRGDLLVLRAGDQVLVDGTVVAGEIQVDESLLTGESDLVRRCPGEPVYSGTYCMGGSGSYEADRVGTASVAQQITAGARSFRQVRTPLEREVGLVIQVMAVLMLALGVQVALRYREAEGDLPLLESVRAAAVIAALVPQGLAFMVTVTYAMAAVRMAGKGALIQRMNAVESTSHVDVLCLDKTGTLTTNNLRLEEVSPIGVTEDALRSLLGTFAASTTAGNRTTATLAAALGGVAGPVREEAAFSSERKWSALGLEKPRGVYVLGAPEMLLPSLRPRTDLPDIQSRIDAWTAGGLRVLLFAYRDDLVALHDAEGEPHLPPALDPLGLVCLSDELRPEAADTVRRFAEAGIRLKVISGDNPETVAALARQAGMGDDLQAVSGLDLVGTDTMAIEETAERAAVFGRITPQQKRDLVDALRRRGHYVAMIGDGVNDVLALKAAHLAVAVRSGSPVTRDVADIVLVNDSFAALPAAFREGQRILRGMQDIIRLFLVRTFSVALIILATSLLGQHFPLSPRHNGVLALLTVGIPTVLLAIWARPGVTPHRLLPAASHFVIPAALTITGVSLVVNSFYLSVTDDLTLARTALTTTTVLCGLLLILFLQPPSPAWTGGAPLVGDWRPVALAAAMLALYVVILAVGPLRRFAEMDTLHWSGYAMLALVVTAWAVALRFIWRLPVRETIGRLRRRRPWASVPEQPPRA
jgi:cation-transporting ATPase E